MTFHGVMGLVYIGAITIAALSLAIIIIMKKRRIINIKGANFYLLITVCCLLLINVMYFLIDYYSIIINYYKSGRIIRIFDIWLAISMQFAWFMLLNEMLFKDKTIRLLPIIKYGYFVLFAAAFVNYGFIMGEGYVVKDEALKTISVALELLVSGFMLVVNAAFIILIIKKFYKKRTETDIKRFALISTIIISIDGLQNTKVSINLIVGNIELHAGYEDGTNITAIARLLFGMFLLWYVIKHCFLEQYQRPPETAMADKKLLNEEERLEKLAMEAELTERETVIMKLLYAGSTYQDIADYLYISKNTVKHHITSIYKKLGVSSKMEMINTVRVIENDVTIPVGQEQFN